MNADVLVLALLAIADIAFLVHLRRRHGRRAKMERMMASMRRALARENAVEALLAKRRWLRAS